jgi:hypothetical protein
MVRLNAFHMGDNKGVWNIGRIIIGRGKATI